MSYRKSFESYEASGSSRWYTGDRIRELSVSDRKPFTLVEDEAQYRAEQSRLYPPDGYYKKVVKTKLPNGKRAKSKVENRAHPAEYRTDYETYKSGSNLYRSSHAEYERQNNIYRMAEAGTTARHLYEGSSSKRMTHEERGGVYYPMSHQRLRESSNAREEHAYE